MRSVEKTVVFARHTDGKKAVTYPVSVHANKAQATAFKTKLATVHATGDVEAVKTLTPAIKMTEAGTLHDNISFALVVLPYNPATDEPTESADDFTI